MRIIHCLWLAILSLSLLSFRAHSQQVEVVGIDQVKQLLQNQSDTVHIVNFWATWCAPCVKELPDFLRISENYKNNNVRLWLVSMDFQSALNTKLKPLLQKRNITHPVWLLNNTDYDSWIGQVDEQWQGDIPMTLIFNNQRNMRIRINGEVDYERLLKVLEEML
ncbi:TlpA family protein disulfide reductase [Rhodoflexus sp.]